MKTTHNKAIELLNLHAKTMEAIFHVATDGWEPRWSEAACNHPVVRDVWNMASELKGVRSMLSCNSSWDGMAGVIKRMRDQARLLIVENTILREEMKKVAAPQFESMSEFDKLFGALPQYLREMVIEGDAAEKSKA